MRKGGGEKEESFEDSHCDQFSRLSLGSPLATIFLSFSLSKNRREADYIECIVYYTRSSEWIDK